MEELPGGDGCSESYRDLGERSRYEVDRVFFFQAEDGIRDYKVTGVQTCALPICSMDDESSQRELKALERLRELRHPFLLMTHRFEAYEDKLVIVMELADGSLQDQIGRASCRERV